jgi:excisionase family DNA binding protein
LGRCGATFLSSKIKEITVPGKKRHMNPVGLLSFRDAAKILSISHPTLEQWIRKKKLHNAKAAGAHHRMPESELEEFLHRVSTLLAVSERCENFRRISG